MAKKFGFEEVSGKRRTVDLYQGCLGAWPAIVKDARDEALAGSGFTSDDQCADRDVDESIENLSNFCRGLA